ncbi:MAG: A24 family peptidase [Pseudomonadota bacterium]
MPPHIFEIAFCTGMVAAGLCDLKTRRVPNKLNIALFVGGLLVRVAVGGLASMAWGIAGAAVGFVVLLVPFQIRWLGAGDVKLIMAAGAWLGPKAVAWAILYGLAAGGLLSVIMTILGGRRHVREVANNIVASFLTLSPPGVEERPPTKRVPMAVALGLAAIGVLAWQGGLHV